MRINEAVALVTGANGALGRALCLELMRRGATVIATARQPERIDVSGARLLGLDVTDASSVAAAATAAPDVNLLINNAGYMGVGNVTEADTDVARLAMETSYFGSLAMTRAFAPVLAANGGGAILNVLSILAWARGDNSTLGVAKTAQWALTNATRRELAAQGTHVAALTAALIDSEGLRAYLRSRNLTLPPEVILSPADVARLAVDGLESGQTEIVDELSRQARHQLGSIELFDFDLERIARDGERP